MEEMEFIAEIGAKLLNYTALFAGIVLLLSVVRGYRRGILAEMSGLIALAVSLIVMLLCTPVVVSLCPEEWGQAPRAAVYLLISYLTYQVVKQLAEKIGILFRKIPIIGWVIGVLGAIAGCVEAVLLMMIFQVITGIDVSGAVQEATGFFPNIF